MDKMKTDRPGIEFEGPQGFFYDVEGAPIESLADGLVQIINVGEKRGFTLDQMVALGMRR